MIMSLNPDDESLARTNADAASVRKELAGVLGETVFQDGIVSERERIARGLGLDIGFIALIGLGTVDEQTEILQRINQATSLKALELRQQEPK